MRWKLFQSTRDEVDVLLSDLQRQGAGRARLAHFFATLLVVLFSAGSLVALGSDALNAVIAQWQKDHTLDIPSTISLAVSFLMVLAMDMALIHAAGMLRVLASRRAELGERSIHIAVMVVVSALEAGTYGYMSWRYEHPTTLAAQALISARSLAAPLLAVYLSMAKPLPVTARDMLAYAELASGGGVLRDVVSAANNRPIDLPAFAGKMRLYAASAIMIPEDKARLQGMIQAVVEGANSSGPYTHAQEGAQAGSISEGLVTPLGSLEPSESHPGHDFDRPPTGPGSPAALPVRTDDFSEQNGKAPATIRLVSDRPKRAAARGSTRSRVRTRGIPINHEEIARAAWANGATSVERMRRATGMSKSTAQSYVRTFKAENAVRAEQSAQKTAQ